MEAIITISESQMEDIILPRSGTGHRVVQRSSELDLLWLESKPKAKARVMSAFSTKPNTLKKIGLKGVVRLPFYGFGSPKETLTTPFR